MATSRHTRYQRHTNEHQPTRGSDGTDGACIARHHSDCRKDHSCKHRWQAYLAALKEEGLGDGAKPKKKGGKLYNWPKYKPIQELIESGETVKFVQHKKTKTGKNELYAGVGGKQPKGWRFVMLRRPPAQNEWCISGDWGDGEGNFQARCYKPYWHESHHVIPDSVLHAALNERYDADVAQEVRLGLLQEKYNINEQLNMILLPMDGLIAQTLNLPRHRRTNLRDHPTYSKLVLSEVKKKLDSVSSAALEKCKKTELAKLKAKLEKLSKDFYKKIKNAGKTGKKKERAEHLDDM